MSQSNLVDSGLVVANEEWKKPNDLMKRLKIRRKKNVQSRSMSMSQPITNVQTHDKIQKPRINPFAKKRSNSETEHTGKRRILSFTDNLTPNEETIVSNISDIYDDNRDSSFSSTQSVFDATKKSPEENKELTNNDLTFVYLNEDSIQGIFTENFSKQQPKIEEGRNKFPPDWSIKTKARFLSPSTFAWCARMKGGEEAQVIRSSTTLQPHKAENCSQTDLRVELGKNLVYWQHPSIPWFTLFPRFGAECKLTPHSTGEAVTDDRIKSSLYDSWAAAFRSAYQLLRQNLCPYFYVCSQMYTALFRSEAVSQSGVNCILTPTSLGFRNSLSAEGITFTMPLKPTESVNEEALSETQDTDSHCETTQKTEQTNDNKENTGKSNQCEKMCEQDDEEDEELSWKKISDGLNLRQCREIASATQNDGLPRTAVLVCGTSNTQLLFNYLLNCRSSIANSGPQAGVPPTIISPHPFMGSTMKKLEYKAGIARTTAEGPKHLAPTSMQHNFSLDVSGPLLPHHVFGIMSLLNSSQTSGEYSAALSTKSYTIPFNAPSTVTGHINSETSDCGLSKECHEWFCSSEHCTTMRQVTATNGMFTWTS